MKKIILIFIALLLLISTVFAGFGGGNPGSAGAAGSGGISQGITEISAPIKGQEKIILGVGEYTTFEVFGKIHTLRVLKIDPTNVIINIEPTGIVQKINVYATRRFDLNKNGLEDFLVKFQDYSMSKVILYYAVVAEEAVEKQIEEKAKEEESKESEKLLEEIKEKDYSNLIYTIIVILIIALIAYSWYRYKNKK